MPATTRRSALFVTLLAATVLALPPAANAATEGSGRAMTETREVGSFDAIASSGSIDIVVRQAEKEAVTVTADDNLVPLIETVVESGRLAIRVKRGESLRPRTPMLVRVDVARLRAVSLSGSGDLTVQTLKTPELKLSIAGSSDARFDALAADSFEVSVAGSGDVRASGQTGRLKVSIAGSGDAALDALAADEVSVSIAGSGDAAVQANRSLEVSIAGSGDVRYRGAVQAVKSRVMGSGSVTRQP